MGWANYYFCRECKMSFVKWNEHAWMDHFTKTGHMAEKYEYWQLEMQYNAQCQAKEGL